SRPSRRCGVTRPAAAATPPTQRSSTGRSRSFWTGMAADRRADYGIDAPYVIRNLLIAGASLWAIAAAALAGILPAVLDVHPSRPSELRFPVTFNAAFVGLWFVGAGAWMYIGSRYGKIAERERLLNHVPWTGAERVLDVGCGRGLMLVGAARRLTTGSA